LIQERTNPYPEQKHQLQIHQELETRDQLTPSFQSLNLDQKTKIQNCILHI